MKTMKIADSKLYTVEKALSYLKNIIYNLDNWKELTNFIPATVQSYLEYKSAYAAFFVASLELTKDGKILLKQSSNNSLEIIKNN